MTNYSILQENTLAGFSESAGILYLKLLEVFQNQEKKAFLAACRYENKVAGVLGYILENSPCGLTCSVKSELSKFFSERWRHNFMELSK